ncbi:MAG: 23S rRNA (adenine(2030)-N(6))-methyltransferase RlmJ [Victivallaceae bacterium]|nr:23S rRNA (adenine(2030)-N(6))-methyltransferase RlmJ [Victivallaceae bacterium]
MANRHFSKLGDVWKHLIFAEILQNNPPAQYWETHAGSAYYDLITDSTRQHGVIQFIKRAGNFLPLNKCAYLKVLQSLPGKYPGSAAIAMRIIGNHARYTLCDTDPASAENLKQESASLDAQILIEDGMTAICRQASVTTAPGNILVCIDPYDPFERAAQNSPNSVELAISLARAGFRVFYWYGYDNIKQCGWVCDSIADKVPAGCHWCGDFQVPAAFIYPENSGLWGGGILLLNTNEEEKQTAQHLSLALEKLMRDDVLLGNTPERLLFASLL